MSPLPTRIVLIDDHPLMRAGIDAALRATGQFQICGEAANAREARKLIAEVQPDGAVLDLVLGDEDGLTLVRELRQLAPGMRIVVLSTLERVPFGLRALAAGADAFVQKTQGIPAIVDALLAPGPGLRPDSTHLVSDAAASASDGIDIALLSDRELQVFRLVGLGRTTKEISSALGISPKTVDAHKEHIKLRLSLGNAAQLTAHAARWVAEQTGL